MDKKITLITTGILLALAVLVVAQAAFGGSGGSLGISTDPLVTNHHWKGCKLTGQAVRFNVTAEHSIATERIRWKGFIIFNGTERCIGNLGDHVIDYSGWQGTPQEAFSADVKRKYEDEYNKEFVMEGNYGINGSFTG